MDFCWKCGGMEYQHICGRCPQRAHVDITAAVVERVNATGHPRLVKRLMDGTADVLRDVHIKSLIVVSE